MRSFSQRLADTFSTRSQVRFQITSYGRNFHVFAIPGYTLLDALRIGKQWIKRNNHLQPTISQIKQTLEEVRNGSDTASYDTLNRVMPDVVAYVRSLNERVAVRTTRHFVVYL